MLGEEITHIAREKDFEKLLASNRTTIPELSPQFFGTTNPDGPGHEWVKARWAIPDIPTGPVTTIVVGRKRVFIPSTVYDNQVLIDNDPDYLLFLQSIQDDELKRAWLEGSWEGFGIEGAYYRSQIQAAEEQGRIVSGLYEPELPVHTWCDLGIADSFAIGYFQVTQSQWRVIGYDEFEGESLKWAINKMRERQAKNDWTWGEHYAPHDIEVRELGTGVTRKETARELGIDYNVVPKLGVMDGIDALRMRFPTLWFDRENTQELLKRLRRYHKEFDEKRGIYKNKPYHDENSHGADMMRYWAVTEHYTPDAQQILRVHRNRQRNRSMV
jgi:hypothetical protein